MTEWDPGGLRGAFPRARVVTGTEVPPSPRGHLQPHGGSSIPTGAPPSPPPCSGFAFFVHSPVGANTGEGTTSRGGARGRGWQAGGRGSAQGDGAICPSNLALKARFVIAPAATSKSNLILAPKPWLERRCVVKEGVCSSRGRARASHSLSSPCSGNGNGVTGLSPRVPHRPQPCQCQTGATRTGTCWLRGSQFSETSFR